MAPPQYACSQCGSVDFEEADGIWYCQNGHEQEGGQQIGQDDADFGKSGKLSRRKEAEEKQKVPKIHRGVKGFRLFLKAWQHVLWRQSYVLIHQYGHPEELWIVVRELWALRLSRLAQRMEDSAEADTDQPLDLSATSESGTDNDDHENLKVFKTGRNVDENPTLAETIALNYIGMLVLQLPTRLSTIYRYVRQEQVLYIRAIRHVPQEIRDHLAPEYHLALDTTVIPNEHGLQSAVYKTAIMYGHAFDMKIPPLNWTPILFENVKKLALPLEVYPAVKSLASKLNFRFIYPERHVGRRSATTYPEVQLMALVLVATKLLYPFDYDTKRYPRSSYEPASMKLSWDAWLESKRSTATEVDDITTTPQKAIEVTDGEILKMSDSQLDQYMDWFQQTYVKDMREEKVHKQILDMFPLQDIPSSNLNKFDSDARQQGEMTRLKDTQAKLKPRHTAVDSSESVDVNTVMRPGQQYQQYTALNHMSEAAASFHREAAELACISVEALLRACLRVERLLLRHQHEQRRADLFDEMDQRG